MQCIASIMVIRVHIAISFDGNAHMIFQSSRLESCNYDPWYNTCKLIASILKESWRVSAIPFRYKVRAKRLTCISIIRAWLSFPSIGLSCKKELFNECSCNSEWGWCQLGVNTDSRLPTGGFTQYIALLI